MEVLISWSGERSKQVAELIRDWLKGVLQNAKPWMSSEDIDRGAVWFDKLNGKLSTAKFGILCLCQANKDSSWILFEAGALAKGLSTARVCPFLIDLESSEVTGPLAQFNHARPEKAEFFKLNYWYNAPRRKFKSIEIPFSAVHIKLGWFTANSKLARARSEIVR